jgi:hypothetical protein
MHSLIYCAVLELQSHELSLNQGVGNSQFASRSAMHLELQHRTWVGLYDQNHDLISVNTSCGRDIFHHTHTSTPSTRTSTNKHHARRPERHEADAALPSSPASPCPCPCPCCPCPCRPCSCCPCSRCPRSRCPCHSSPLPCPCPTVHVVPVCPSPVTTLKSWRVAGGGGARRGFPTVVAETTKLAKMMATATVTMAVTAVTVA